MGSEPGALPCLFTGTAGGPLCETTPGGEGRRLSVGGSGAAWLPVAAAAAALGTLAGPSRLWNGVVLTSTCIGSEQELSGSAVLKHHMRHMLL